METDATIVKPAMTSPSDSEGLERHWSLEPGLAFLNHGSFGACPRTVQALQQELREELERQPISFFLRGYEGRLDAARETLARFLGADPEGLVTVTNATSGVNAVLRSLRFEAGDELVFTSHGYNACNNALKFVAERWGAKVVTASVPLPLAGPGQVVAAVLAAVGPRTRLVLVDHITSPTGLVLPVAEIVRELTERGVDTLVDAAHAPGMLPLDLDAIGAAYYTGNCHKWLCAPKGAAFLYVREDRRELVRPLVISHGTNTPRPGRSRFHDEFDWVGTGDPTPFLCVPTALETMESLVPGGWPEIRERNRALALRGRDILCDALGVAPTCPDEMVGSLVAIPLPEGSLGPTTSALATNPLQDALLEDFRVEVPVFPWPAPPKRLVRISAQLYNRPEHYRRLAEGLVHLLGL